MQDSKLSIKQLMLGQVHAADSGAMDAESVNLVVLFQAASYCYVLCKHELQGVRKLVGPRRVICVLDSLWPL